MLHNHRFRVHLEPNFHPNSPHPSNTLHNNHSRLRDFNNLDRTSQAVHQLLDPAPPLDRSTTDFKACHPTRPLHMAACQTDRLVFPLRPDCPSDPHLAHRQSLLIKCSNCTMVHRQPHFQVNRVAGKAMGGKVKTRNQLCHQLILLILKAMGIIRLTHPRWTTWFQALPERLMTLTR